MRIFVLPARERPLIEEAIAREARMAPLPDSFYTARELADTRQCFVLVVDPDDSAFDIVRMVEGVRSRESAPTAGEAVAAEVPAPQPASFRAAS